MVLFVVVAKASTFPSCLQFICLVSWRANDLRSTFNAFYLPWRFSFFLPLQTWTPCLRPCFLFLSRFKKQRLCCLLLCLGIKAVGDVVKLLLTPGHLGLAPVGLRGSLRASFCMQCDQNTCQTREPRRSGKDWSSCRGQRWRWEYSGWVTDHSGGKVQHGGPAETVNYNWIAVHISNIL